ncbi:MAG TPA: hypothetical protein VHK24_02065 [Steroidobacter sp.]|jgi:hypothetical protein|nr:hypothetical protein [Steroidobacter sp.]
MKTFFDKMPYELAMSVEQLSRLAYELRENRSKILAQYGVSDEVELLERMRTGQAPEHPTYEHYLGLRVLADSRDAVRTEIQNMLSARRNA